MNTFQSFSFGSIILVDDALRLPLQQSLLKEKRGMLGVSFLSLKNWIKQFQSNENHDDALLFAYRQLLEEHKEQFPIFRSQFSDSAFLKECANFVQELKLYDVPLDSLPSQTPSERERKQLLSLLLPLPCAGDEKKKALRQIQAITDASHIFIYPSFFTYYEQTIIQLLLEKGAAMLQAELQEQTPAFYYAVNMRQEIEGIAQMIIEKGQLAEDISLCVLDPFYEPLAAQIFDRYHIPYTIVSSSLQVDLSAQMQAWLHYLANPSQQTLIDLLNTHAFAFETNALIQYTQLFHERITDPIQLHSNQIQTGALFDEYTLKQIQKLEEKAIQQQTQLLPVLQEALSCSPQEVLAFLCDQFAKRYPKPSEEQLRCMKQIQDLFHEVYDHLHVKEDLGFLEQLLKAKQIATGYDQLQGVMIHTIKELHHERKIRYVCGATMDAWPNFVPRKGIFDEKYCVNLALPSMEQRYQQHLMQCEQLYHAQQTLIVTYPLGTYEGKTKEASLEMEQYMESYHVQAKALPLSAVHIQQRHLPALDTSIAKQLYLQDGKLKGSISAFERYRQCPYSYFLRYGLRLKKQKSEVDDAKIGSLIHALLQQLCEEHGKAYVQIATKELIERIQNEFLPLHQLYPKREQEIKQWQIRLTKQLQVLFSTLSSLEEHNHLQARGFERPFTYTLPLSAANLEMHGVIDRIDTSNHMGVILDYKSSKKTLSAAKVYSGLQLQLLTYAIVLEEGDIPDFEEIKEVLGAFYISTKMENIQQPALKIQRQKKTCVPVEKEEMIRELQKKQRLNGWIFSTSIDLFDDDATHVANLKMDNNGAVVGRDKNAIRSLSSLKAGIQKILTYIGENILQGNIVCEPSENACSYCDFHCICRFHGQPYPKAAIIDEQMEYCIDLPHSLKEKEEEVDAKLE